MTHFLCRRGDSQKFPAPTYYPRSCLRGPPTYFSFRLSITVGPVKPAPIPPETETRPTKPRRPQASSARAKTLKGTSPPPPPDPSSTKAKAGSLLPAGGNHGARKVPAAIRQPALPAAAGAGDADLHGRHHRGHPLRGRRAGAPSARGLPAPPHRQGLRPPHRRPQRDWYGAAPRDLESPCCCSPGFRCVLLLLIVCARRNEAEVPARGHRWGQGPAARLRGAPGDWLLSRAAHPARALRQSAHIDSAQR
jgi:hypothetical protein